MIRLLVSNFAASETAGTALVKGFRDECWKTAQDELRRLLISTAKAKSVIAYSDVVSQIKSIGFEPHDHSFHRMLDALSIAEDEAGRGLLTVLVVHRSDDFRPGTGFFELAKSRGRNVDDIDATWLAELRSVWDFWLTH